MIPLLSYHRDVMFIVYADDGIFSQARDKQLSSFITEMQNLDLDIASRTKAIQQITWESISSASRMALFELSHRALIDNIIQDGDLNDSKVKAVTSQGLRAFACSPHFSLNFNYRSMIGKLNYYLDQSTRPDIHIMYATPARTTWRSSSLSCAVPQEISGHRNPLLTGSQQGIRVLFKLLWTLEQAIFSS